MLKYPAYTAEDRNREPGYFSLFPDSISYTDLWNLAETLLDTEDSLTSQRSLCRGTTPKKSATFRDSGIMR